MTRYQPNHSHPLTVLIQSFVLILEKGKQNRVPKCLLKVTNISINFFFALIQSFTHFEMFEEIPIFFIFTYLS